jgi:hypothetical protein
MLVAESPNLRRAGSRGLTALARLAASVPAYRLTAGTVDGLGALLEPLVVGAAGLPHATNLITRAPQIVERRTLRGVMLLGPRSSEAVELSGTGQLLWDLLASPVSLADLVLGLVDVTGEPETRIAADVVDVVVSLDEIGALAYVDR